MVFPGGWPLTDYKTKAKSIYEQAIKINDQGNYFPILGVCQGFSFLNEFAASAGEDILNKSLGLQVPISVAITLTNDPSETKMFKEAGSLAKRFETVDFAYNVHGQGVKPGSFETDAGLKEMFKLTSTCHDPNKNIDFACSMESEKYPFVGL